MSFGTVRITDLDFADNPVIFTETTEVLSEAIESRSEEAKPLGLRVSWIKTKVQAFGDILYAATDSIRVGGENVGIAQTSTFLGDVIYSWRGSPKIIPPIGSCLSGSEGLVSYQVAARMLRGCVEWKLT